MVGKELRTDKRMDLFAATPPLESLRVLCSLCASNQRTGRPNRMMSIDVKRAYFYAPALRLVYVEIPIEGWEHGDEARVARLNLSTRDAVQNWSEQYSSDLRKWGFTMGRASPRNFHHANKW